MKCNVIIDHLIDNANDAYEPLNIGFLNKDITMMETKDDTWDK